jgi:hypothetical protein
MWGTLKLWTAHRLLMKGWEMNESYMLGMPLVTDNQSSLYGTIPAPRPIQNKGDHQLESYIADLELLCLKELQETMLHKHRQPRDWVVIFIAVLIILQIRERDIWRLEYWILRSNEVSH